MNAVVETSDTSGLSRGEAGEIPKTVVRLGWVSALTDVSSEMIVPLLPAFLTTVLRAPATALGWIEGVAETTASFVKIAAGPLSDRARTQKPLVLAGYGLSSLARPLIGLAPGWVTIVLIRLVDRVGKGVRTGPRDMIIARVTPPGRRGAAFGLHRGFDNAGAIVGPLLAAGLVALGVSLRGAFLLAAVPGFLSLAVLAFGVKEDAPAPPEAPPQEASGPLGGDFWRFTMLLTVFTLALSSDTFLLLRAQELGIALAWCPVLWCFSNAVRAVFSKWGGSLSDRHGRRKLILAAWVLYAACYAAFAFVANAWLFVAIVGVYSFHYALTEGAAKALVTDLVQEDVRGRAFGWMNGLTGLAALPASLGFGFIWQKASSRTAFLVGAAIAAVAAIGLLVLGPSRTNAPDLRVG